MCDVVYGVSTYHIAWEYVGSREQSIEVERAGGLSMKNHDQSALSSGCM